MTEKEIKEEIERVKSTLDYLQTNENSYIRRFGIDAYQAQIDFALIRLKLLLKQLEELND